MTKQIRALGGRVVQWVDLRDVLTFGGVGLVSWGVGGSNGVILAGMGLFYLGALHPLVLHFLARRE
jgi:hypothetical protein